MYASHWSYGRRCGLGSPETDLLVRLIRERGAARGLYGAKITGGGSGGTVAVLCREDTDATIEEIAAEYAEQTGIAPAIFVGTSAGSRVFGVRRA